MDLQVIRKEMLADGRITAYRFDSTGTEAAEEWYGDMQQTFDTMQDEDELLLLMDLSVAEDGYLSAEGFMRAKQISHIKYHGKTAVLLTEADAARIMAQFLDKGMEGSRPRAVFSSEADAVAWLLA